MYTIKQASIRSGLTISTIRAWERRYAAVRPTRTEGGYRLYDDEAIDRLVAMRHLVEVEGIRPSQAADQVRDGGPAVEALAGRARQADVEVAAGSGRPPEGSIGPAVSGLRDATRRMDIAAIERLLDEAFAAERFESAASNVVFPALRIIGEDWAAGTIDVAMEHAASETIRRRLARFFDAAGDPASPPDVIVGLPPGCQHEIGAMGFAVAARRRGLRVLYLGVNVPESSWVRISDALPRAVAVVGVVRAADAAAATGVVRALLASAGQPTVVVGGRAASGVAAATGAVALPDQVDEAVEVVDRLVRPSDQRDGS